ILRGYGLLRCLLAQPEEDETLREYLAREWGKEWTDAGEREQIPTLLKRDLDLMGETGSVDPKIVPELLGRWRVAFREAVENGLVEIGRTLRDQLVAGVRSAELCVPISGGDEAIRVHSIMADLVPGDELDLDRVVDRETSSLTVRQWLDAIAGL